MHFVVHPKQLSEETSKGTLMRMRAFEYSSSVVPVPDLLRTKTIPELEEDEKSLLSNFQAPTAADELAAEIDSLNVRSRLFFSHF